MISSFSLIFIKENNFFNNNKKKENNFFLFRSLKNVGISQFLLQERESTQEINRIV